jgi:hypothetical protein
MKKIIGIFGILMLLIGASLVPQAIGKEENQNFDKTLFVIGFIHIDSTNYEINGFVLVGNDAGQAILFEKINIKCDGPPVLVYHPLPFIFNIKYNPA